MEDEVHAQHVEWRGAESRAERHCQRGGTGLRLNENGDHQQERAASRLLARPCSRSRRNAAPVRAAASEANQQWKRETAQAPAATAILFGPISCAATASASIDRQRCALAEWSTTVPSWPARRGPVQRRSAKGQSEDGVNAIAKRSDGEGSRYHPSQLQGQWRRACRPWRTGG